MSVEIISIDTIGLSVRSMNALRRNEIYTVGDLLQYDEERLFQLRNLGRKSVDEILAKIEEYKDLATSSWVPEEPEAEQSAEDIQNWFASESGKTEIMQWLREKKTRIDVLELLSARAYNLLMLNECEYLHQLAFQTTGELLKIPRMDEICAAEIIKWVDTYICQNVDDIYTGFRKNTEQSPVTLDDMRFMPKHQDRILEFVHRNDIDVESMPISTRSKNQLQKNGYCKLSEIIFLREEQIRQIPAMGAASAEQIAEVIQNYLKKHEHRIIAFCNGDVSVLWDDTAIRKKILRLYQERPFDGFSLKEMTEKLDLPDAVSQERIKKIIGGLLAERKLEYVDFRCYRIYEKFESFLPDCDAVDARSKHILQLRLQGKTLEEIGREFDLTRERVRQIIKKKTGEVRNRYAMITGDRWFDEDYYWYFYENYAFDRREASHWMGIPEAVWAYLDMMDIKQGKKDLELALDDSENLEIGLRLKVKNYLNRNKIFVDGIWVEKKRSELEPIVAKKFCRTDLSFDQFAAAFNHFLEEEEIPYDEDLYYTEAVIRTRKNRMAEARFLLWKQNEMLRYYDIDSRDYSELLETLKLDTYENVEYSTVKFLREYPLLMEKYDIRDQYELHNLLRKIIPEGSFHDFHCSRTPHIRFGSFDRDTAILDILIDMAPVTPQDLCERISEEYGYDPMVIWANYLQSFQVYYHEGIYSVDQKAMPSDRMAALHRMLPDDFYYIDEIRKTYARLYPDADMEEINPYNLKSMGFIVLSRYVVQHYPSLEAYCEHLLTREDIVDLRPLRKRLTYVVMFSNKLMEMKRNLDVIEFEPGQILNFRKLARAGITKEDIRDFCDAVYDFVSDGKYFCSKSLKEEGFESELYDLGFSDWFYANLLISDERFSYTNAFGNIILCKERKDITIQSFLVNRICDHGWIDTYDLMTELEERFGCTPEDKWDIIYRLKNTQVYYDKILDRLYANVDLYYRDLDEGGF
ncbi:MAG: hypothetical protein IJN20_03690 [Oscillospiraceae bacterium]|nr:hypothetical protein [Oscillospiraceae bacterium]